MEKISGSNNLDKKLEYRLTHQTNKMSDLAGACVKPTAWMRYVDDVDSEKKSVVSIMVDDKPYATISEAFIREFDDITATFDDDEIVLNIEQKKSKNNRDYIICTLA